MDMLAVTSLRASTSKVWDFRRWSNTLSWEELNWM